MKPKFWKELQSILKQHNWKSARANGRASFETAHKRAEILHGGFKTLWRLGCKLQSPRSFREYHMKRLARHWEAQGIKDLQTRISIFRVFAGWIGKKGMIRESVRYVENPQSVRRHYATREDKTWSGQDVDVMERLEEVAAIDARVALILELQLLFGLRIKEAMLLRPHLADREFFLAVNRGTKGGRDRTVDITDAAQRDALRRAKAFAPDRTSSLIPKDKSFACYRKYIYRVCNRAGIGRRFGLVAHGLRHEYANLKYQQLTGRPSPIKGGEDKDASDQTEPAARQDIAEDLGHSRPSITSAYCGYVREMALKSRKMNSKTQ